MHRLILLVAAAGCFGMVAAELDPAQLFEPPVALVDGSGKALLTGLAEGCPFAADFNGDGKVDLILGAHENMDTAVGGIWLLPNSGSNEKPVFDWSAAQRVATAEGDVKVGCG